MAGSLASAEGIWFIRLGKDLGLDFSPVPLYTDNQSYIAFSKAAIHNKRTKHIDIQYHYTRDQIEKGNILLLYIPGTDNPADILTKPLPPYKHRKLCVLLGIS